MACPGRCGPRGAAACAAKPSRNAEPPAGSLPPGAPAFSPFLHRPPGRSGLKAGRWSPPGLQVVDLLLLREGLEALVGALDLGLGLGAVLPLGVVDLLARLQVLVAGEEVLDLLAL